MSKPIRHPWLLVASLATLGLLTTLYAINLSGIQQLAAANRRIAVAQKRETYLADYLRNLIDMETGQRGYLLTHDQRYLQPYTDAIPKLESLGDTLADQYIRGGDSADLRTMLEISALASTKSGVMASALRLDQQVGSESALELIKTNLGADVGKQARLLIDHLVSKEQAAIKDSTLGWDRDLSHIRSYLLFSMVLNALVVVLSAAMFARTLGRRNDQVKDLDQRLKERNAELSVLSTHLQRLSELEKANLARELHDELGGLLVASKMDAVWLRAQWPNPVADVNLRLQRITRTLDEGLNLKRRIIETLRPSLLDNMGLIPALRWLFDETCRRAGLQCHEQLPTQDPHLSDDARIALFRIVQEALTNVLKHARAHTVTLAMDAHHQSLSLSIRDDGVGMQTSLNRSMGHGLLNMKHRAFSLGGECVVSSTPSGGTVVTATVPLEPPALTTAIGGPDS